MSRHKRSLTIFWYRLREHGYRSWLDAVVGLLLISRQIHPLTCATALPFMCFPLDQRMTNNCRLPTISACSVRIAAVDRPRLTALQLRHESVCAGQLPISCLICRQILSKQYILLKHDINIIKTSVSFFSTAAPDQMRKQQVRIAQSHGTYHFKG